MEVKTRKKAFITFFTIFLFPRFLLLIRFFAENCDKKEKFYSSMPFTRVNTIKVSLAIVCYLSSYTFTSLFINHLVMSLKSFKFLSFLSNIIIPFMNSRNVTRKKKHSHFYAIEINIEKVFFFSLSFFSFFSTELHEFHMCDVRRPFIIYLYVRSHYIHLLCPIKFNRRLGSFFS